jgi:dTDP-4-dehydrorhamnose reductase
MKRILITGAGGQIGRVLRAGLAGHYALRLADIAPQSPAGEHEEVVTADITRPDALRAIMEGVDTVVHLAGIPDEDTWQKIRDMNIDGCYNVFEAARQAGVKRVVFASSNHAVGFHRRDRMIDDTVMFRPDSRYGVSKVSGRARRGISPRGSVIATWFSSRAAASMRRTITSSSCTACRTMRAIAGAMRMRGQSAMSLRTMARHTLRRCLRRIRPKMKRRPCFMADSVVCASSPAIRIASTERS